MSIERHERSPSFRSRQKTVKVNHTSKLLPTDFFPKTLSQSPKKRPEFPCSAEVLDWYQRDDSKDKPSNQGPQTTQFHRFSHNRISKNRINLCLALQPTKMEKQRYVLDYCQQIKEKLGGRMIQPHKIQMQEQAYKVNKDKISLIRHKQPVSKEREQKRIRIIRSEGKAKERRDTSESIKKVIREYSSPSRRSLREIPKRTYSNEVTVGFDGMVTFSRLK